MPSYFALTYKLPGSCDLHIFLRTLIVNINRLTVKLVILSSVHRAVDALLFFFRFSLTVSALKIGSIMLDFSQ